MVAAVFVYDTFNCRGQPCFFMSTDTGRNKVESKSSRKSQIKLGLL